MKRVLSILLAVCLLLGVLPMAAGAKGQNRYTAVIEQLIKERMGSKDYCNHGLFYDLDGDGIEEMLIVRTCGKNYPETRASLYTIVDGEAVNLMKDELLYIDAGGIRGYIAALEKSGKTYFGIYTEGEAASPPGRRNGSWRLYRIDRTTGKLVKTNTATFSYNMAYGGGVTNAEAAIDGKSVTYNQYLAWVDTLNMKGTVSGSYTEKTQYTFEALLSLSKADTTGDLPATTVGGFKDVFVESYYANAVKWAVESGITSGIGGGKFAPANTCKREQIVTFLYRSKSSPAVSVTGQFTDMPKNEEFQRAISWAVENNITLGDGKGRFNPEKGCTRAEAMTFIWRAAGKPDPKTTAAFSDMPANQEFCKAISWAVENGIAHGTGNNKFSPNDTCRREHIVTFLYNAKDI